jgi:predicted phage terminase large subunit-like protein
MIDDPQNPKMAFSEAERKTSIDFFNFTLSTRLNNPATGLFIIIMQRLHEEDLSGHLLSTNKNGYKHICIPAILSDNVKPDEIKKYYKDELFFPGRFTKEYLEKIKTQLGSYQYAGQMLQRSSPAEGGILKRQYWQYYDRSEITKFDRVLLSVDCTFKDLSTSDYVVIQAWGAIRPNKYLIKQYRGKWGFQKTSEMIMLAREECKPSGIYIEDKANGSAIIETLKKNISGIIAVTPHESKFARAMATQPQLEAGNIYLPRNEQYTEDFVEECANFPNAKHDDMVDCFSQAIYVFQKSDFSGSLIVRF